MGRRSVASPIPLFLTFHISHLFPSQLIIGSSTSTSIIQLVKVTNATLLIISSTSDFTRTAAPSLTVATPFTCRPCRRWRGCCA